MDYLADENYFCMDGHIHSSPHNVEKVIQTARKRGLDAIILTDLNRIDTFNALGGILPKNYITRQIDDVTLLVDDAEDDKKPLIIGKGEEIRTTKKEKKDQVDLLAWFIRDLIQCYSIINAVDNIYEQGGIPGMPHLQAKIFLGAGSRKLHEILAYIEQKYQEPKPLFLEDNGQSSPIADRIHHNSLTYEIARSFELPLFRNSDAHCNQHWQYHCIGQSYTAISRDLIAGSPDELKDNLIDVILNHKDQIKIGGKKNNIFSVLAWILELRIRQKLKDFKQGWNNKSW